MAYTPPTDDILRKLLTDSRTIAIVGASGNPDRAAYGIMQKLQSVGYQVIPVTPREADILGEPSYPSLREITVPVDIVVVFRRPEDTPAIADEAVAIGAKALWLQSEIYSEEAAARAAAAGLIVVMDTCIGAMHSMVRIPKK